MFIQWEGLVCHGGSVADPTAIGDPDSEYNRFVMPMEQAIYQVLRNMKGKDGTKLVGVCIEFTTERECQ